MLPISIIIDSPRASIPSGAVCINNIFWLYIVKKYGEIIVATTNNPMAAIKDLDSSYDKNFLIQRETWDSVLFVVNAVHHFYFL